MAPNVVCKSGHVHDSFNNGNPTATARPISLRIKSRVRTEFVVHNIYFYLLESHEYQEQVNDVSAANPAEVEVLEAFKKVVDDFKMSYNDKIVDLCSQLDVTSENISSVYLGVLNELFSEGITWARITSLFVFSSELAALCLRKELQETIVETIRDCCLEFVQDNFENWVKDHGGWEGIISFSKGHNKNADNQLPDGAPSPGWAKTVLRGTLRVFGTFAHLANNTGQIMTLNNMRI